MNDFPDALDSATPPSAPASIPESKPLLSHYSTASPVVLGFELQMQLKR